MLGYGEYELGILQAAKFALSQVNPADTTKYALFKAAVDIAQANYDKAIRAGGGNPPSGGGTPPPTTSSFDFSSLMQYVPYVLGGIGLFLVYKGITKKKGKR